MAKTKTQPLKVKLARAMRQTRWAPFWILPKVFGRKRARRMHPSRVTVVKRSWRRNRIKI